MVSLDSASQSFYNLLLILSQSILTENVYDALSQNSLRLVPIQRMKSTSPGSFEHYTEQVPYLGDIIDVSLKDRYQRKDEVLENVTNCLKDKYLISNDITGQFSSDKVIKAFLNKLYFQIYPSFKWQSEVFQIIYDQLEFELAAEEINCLLIVPLENFSLEGMDEVIIDDRISIRRIDQTYKEKHASGIFVNLWDKYNLFNIEFGIFIPFSRGINNYVSFPNDIDDKSDKVLLALRLTCSGKTQIFHKSWNVKEDSVLHHDMGVTESSNKVKLLSSEDRLILKSEDVQKLKTNFSYIINLEKSHPQEWFKLGVTLFSESYNHLVKEREMLDLIRALEIVFANSGSEISYKTSIRSSCFVGRDNEQRTEIYKNIRTLYNCRNDYVHKNKKMSLPDLKLLPAANRYLTNSLNKILANELYLLQWSSRFQVQLDNLILNK